MRTGCIAAVAAAWLASCGEGGTAGDALADSTPDPAAEPDGAVDPAPDVVDEPAPGLVQIGCYEIELAVNPDADASMFRWYGGLYLAVEGSTVTNVDVTGLEIVEDGVSRAVTDPWLMGGTIDALPRVQREVFGKIDASAGELSGCAGGPSLSRGHGGTDDVLVRLVGTSDQGPWSAECTTPDDEVLTTCHAGISGVADAHAYNTYFPDTPPSWQIEVGATVRFADPVDVGDVTVTSLVLVGETATETYAAPAPTGTACTYSTPPECLVVGYVADGELPGALCPDSGSGFPVELYVVYEGTAGTRSFSGAGPAGQCWKD